MVTQGGGEASVTSFMLLLQLPDLLCRGAILELLWSLRESVVDVVHCHQPSKFMSLPPPTATASITILHLQVRHLEMWECVRPSL